MAVEELEAQAALELGVAAEAVEAARQSGRGIATVLLEQGVLDQARYEQLLKIVHTRSTKTMQVDTDGKTLKLSESDRPEVRAPANLFGKFKLLKELGRGGMGRVYQAYDTALGRVVALKMLIFEDPDDQRRFLQEAHIAAKLNHPGIVQVYEVGEHDGRHYIAMQFVDGASLDRAKLDPRQALEAIRDAALALHYAHQLGVVHRDIKPGNILVSKDGRALVADFGLAKFAGAKSATGNILGTPQFMAPEQARGQNRMVDALTDVYALGATLYAVLTGQPPFTTHEGESAVHLLERVVTHDPPPMRKLNPKLPDEVEIIVAKAMEKDRERRYPSAKNFAEDLDRHLKGEPIMARPASTLYRIRKKLWKRKGIVIAATLGIAACCGVAALLVPRLREERAAKEQTEAKLAEQQERSQALQELATLWTQVALEKQGLHIAANDPKRVLDRLRAAIDRVSKYIARHPDQPQGYYIRARAWLYLNDLEAAERDLQKALSLNDAFSPGHALMARVKMDQWLSRLYRQDGRAPERKGKTDPLLKAAQEHLARGGGELERWGLVRTREEQVTETLLRVRVAGFVENDFTKAYEILAAAIEKDPSEEYFHEYASGRSDPKDRVKWNTRALEHMPHYARALLHRGQALSQLGEQTAAIADLTRAIELNPRDPLAYETRGNAHVHKQNFQEALKDYTRAIELEPADPVLYSNRGIARAYSGDLKGALEDYARALELDPQCAFAYYCRACAYHNNGEPARAMKDYDKAIELDPNMADAYNNRGNARRQVGDPEGAIDDLTRAIQLDPKNPKPYSNRGLAREDLRDIAGALADYDAALKVDPEYVPALNNRASLRTVSGDFEGALQDYDAAIKIRSQMPEPYAGRGWVHESLARVKPSQAAKHLRAAEQDYLKALELAPQHWAHRSYVETQLQNVRSRLRRSSSDY